MNGILASPAVLFTAAIAVYVAIAAMVALGVYRQLRRDSIAHYYDQQIGPAPSYQLALRTPEESFRAEDRSSALRASFTIGALWPLGAFVLAYLLGTGRIEARW